MLTTALKILLSAEKVRLTDFGQHNLLILRKITLKMTYETDFSNLKVLVVDDNPVNRRIIMLLLKGHMHDVEMAANGSQALVRFKEKHYDIILMDIHMPEMNGYESALAIRQYETSHYEGKHSVIIAMTACEEGEVFPQCHDSGMDAYLGKPFMVQQLFEALKKLVKVAG